MRRVLAVLLFLLLPVATWANPSLTQTTTATAVGAAVNQIALASTSGVSAGSRLYLDRELVTVLSIGVNATVTVQRGIGGVQSAHDAGVTVTVGTAGQFYAFDPVGPVDATVPLPWINVTSGNVWTVTNGAWALSQVAGGSVGGGTFSGSLASTQIAYGTAPNTIGGLTPGAGVLTALQTDVGNASGIQPAAFISDDWGAPTFTLSTPADALTYGGQGPYAGGGVGIVPATPSVTDSPGLGLWLVGGLGTGSGAGGPLYLRAGYSGATSGLAGNFEIQGGEPGVGQNGDGGDISIIGGLGRGSGHSGTYILLRGGNSLGGADGGYVRVLAGTASGGGVGGEIELQSAGLNTAGGAGGAKVVCINTSTHILYVSSTSTGCDP